MDISIQLIDKKCMPFKATEGSAGFDLFSRIDQSIKIEPMQRILIPVGFCIELPDYYEAQIRSRSGLSIKNGVCVLNAPGTIDSDYRKEVKVILINLGSEAYEIDPYVRIAQMVVNRIDNYNLCDVEINSSQRGGFGSTGV